MFSKNRDLNCIDIGTHSIKYTKGRFIGGHLHIHQLDLICLPTGSYSEKGIDAQLSALEQLFSKWKIKGSLYLSISHSGNTVYAVHLPEMPHDEMRNAIKWEITQKKKFDEEKDYFDYVDVGKNFEEDGNKKVCLVSVASQEVIKPFLQFFGTQKNNVEVIENQSFSLVNALTHLGLVSDDKAYLLIHVGAAFTHLIVVFEKKMVFERRLNSGGAIFDQSISDYCKVDIDKAHSLKENYGIQTETMSDKIVEAVHILTSNLEKLLADIQYSMKYFSFHVTRSQIPTFDKVFLTGGGSNLNGLIDFIHERLHIPTEKVDFSDNVKLPNKLPLPASEFWPTFHNSFGLLSRDASELGEASTNLLGQRKAKKKTKKKNKKPLDLVGSLFFLLVSILLVFSGKEIYLLKEKEARLKGEVSLQVSIVLDEEDKQKKKEKEMQTFEERQKVLIGRLSETKKRWQSFRNLKVNPNDVAKTLDEIIEVLPSKVFLTECFIDGNSVLLRGIASANEDVSQFMKKINALDPYEGCQFNYTRQSSNEDIQGIEFEIKALFHVR